MGLQFWKEEKETPKSLTEWIKELEELEIKNQKKKYEEEKNKNYKKTMCNNCKEVCRHKKTAGNNYMCLLCGHIRETGKKERLEKLFKEESIPAYLRK